MRDYVIMTDSGCDISAELLEKWGVPCADLTVKFDNDSKEYLSREMPNAEFYRRMRAGDVAKTSAVNVDAFKAMYEEILAQGKDILYIGFSTGLSNTANAGAIAAKEVEANHPGSKIIAIDTLSGSAGVAITIYMTMLEKNKGASIEEAAEFARKNMVTVSQYFTVDDLVYLKRGGRISPAAYFAATLLGIRPIMRVDEEGKLESTAKVRGRKAALKALADKYTELAADPKTSTFIITQAGCYGDAKLLDNMIYAQHGHHATVISEMSPVIGAHAGPGTCAIFFDGKHR